MCSGEPTSRSIQSSIASLTLEVLRLLMRYQNLQIIKVSFTCLNVSYLSMWMDWMTYSSSTKVAQELPRYRDARACFSSPYWQKRVQLMQSNVGSGVMIENTRKTWSGETSRKPAYHGVVANWMKSNGTTDIRLPSAPRQLSRLHGFKDSGKKEKEKKKKNKINICSHIFSHHPQFLCLYRYLRAIF